MLPVLKKAVPVEVIVGVVCFAALIFIGFVPLGLPGRIKARFGLRIPEAGPYSLGRVNGFVDRLGRDGLSMYRRQLVWDVMFAALLGLSLYFLTLQAWAPVWGRGSGLPYLIGLIPLAYVAFDVAEDVTLLIAVRLSNLCLPPPHLSRRWTLTFPDPFDEFFVPCARSGRSSYCKKWWRLLLRASLAHRLPPAPSERQSPSFLACSMVVQSRSPGSSRGSSSCSS